MSGGSISAILSEKPDAEGVSRVTDTLSAQWQISEEAVANSVADETVILHLGNGTYYGLDQVGTLVWEGIAAGKSISAVIGEIVASFDVDQATVETDVAELLASLADNDLIHKNS
jgi:hypothetical protein